MLAICNIRPDPHYRREAFVSGLRRAGYSVESTGRPKSKKDVLVIWNRFGNNESRADQWEAEGGTVLVAENGYIGADRMGRQYYAMAVHGHNGSGWFPMTDVDRFAKLGIQLKPWVDRPDGYSLICGQRGVGSRTMASPGNWHMHAAKRCDGKLKIRLHPGKDALKQPALTSLETDLAGAKRCVVWSSTAGVKALVAGIPVRYDAPRWICSAGASRIDDVEDLKDDDARRFAMYCMAHAQFSTDELETGEPFINIRDNIERAAW